MSLPLAQVDPDVAAAIDQETLRQHEGLEMIASENFVSEAVLEAAGSVFTNKYAEGYPGRRYYGGCEYADIVENLARDRARQLFGGDHINVQPHSGSQANASAYAAVLQPGDTILGLDLSHGGHLTHGHRLSFSGKLYRPTFYHVRRDTETIDYDELESIAIAKSRRSSSAAPAPIRACGTSRACARSPTKSAQSTSSTWRTSPASWRAACIPRLFLTRTSPPPPRTKLSADRAPASSSARKDLATAVDKAVFPGQQGGPLVHIVAAKAVALAEALRPEFRTYAAQIVANAKALAEGLQAAGFRLVSGGTDNHLMLVDVFEKGILGSDAESGSRQSRHHGQQEFHPLGYESSAQTLGHSHRHAGAHHARHERA